MNQIAKVSLALNIISFIFIMYLALSRNQVQPERESYPINYPDRQPYHDPNPPQQPSQPASQPTEPAQPQEPQPAVEMPKIQKPPLSPEKQRTYEWMTDVNAGSTVREIAAHLPMGGTFVDIGANLGAVTNQVAARCPSCYIYSFEPVVPYLNFAQQVCESKCANVTFLPFAVCSAVSVRELYLDTKNLGWNTFIAHQVTPGMTKQTVRCTRFDDIAPAIGITQAAVMKIDTEGFEHSVIAGMHKWLEAQRDSHRLPFIVMEVGWGTLPTSRQDYQEELAMFEYLFSLGYERLSNYQSLSGTQDVVLRPPQ